MFNINIIHKGSRKKSSFFCDSSTKALTPSKLVGIGTFKEIKIFFLSGPGFPNYLLFVMINILYYWGENGTAGTGDPPLHQAQTGGALSSGKECRCILGRTVLTKTTFFLLWAVFEPIVQSALRGDQTKFFDFFLHSGIRNKMFWIF